MKIKSSDGERVEIPLLERPGFRRTAGILDEKTFQTWIIQMAGFQLSGGFFRRERTRIKMGAACKRKRGEDGKLAVHHFVSTMGRRTVTVTSFADPDSIFTEPLCAETIHWAMLKP